MASRRRFSTDDDGPRSGSGRANQMTELGLPDIDIPFRDADPETGEISLHDLDTFVIPSRDNKGASDPINVSVPPIMSRHVDVIIRSGRFPYLRRSDFVRHAIYRHIRWCIGLRQALPKSIITSLDAILEDCREDEHKAHLATVIRKIRDRIEYHMQQGNSGEAVRLISIIRSRLDDTHSDHLSKTVKNTLDSEFFKPMLTGALPKTEDVQ